MDKPCHFEVPLKVAVAVDGSGWQWMAVDGSGLPAPSLFVALILCQGSNPWQCFFATDVWIW